MLRGVGRTAFANSARAQRRFRRAIARLLKVLERFVTLLEVNDRSSRRERRLDDGVEVNFSVDMAQSAEAPEDIGAAAVMVACLPPRAHVTEIIMTGKTTVPQSI